MKPSRSGKTKSHYIHFYYGFGKGKTTATLGLALRAVGQGRKVIMIQWLKGRATIGEMRASKLLAPHFSIKQFGPQYFTWDPPGPGEHKRLARAGLDYLEQVIDKRKFDVLILDELGDALSMRFIPQGRTIALIKKAAQQAEVLVTGHEPVASLMQVADLATEMKKVKHYFEKGQMAREGIEF